MNNFGVIGTEFINLYSKENPILHTDDICYFLFSNLHDYHMTLIGRGIIIEDKFTDGLNKAYYIRCLTIEENPNIIHEFVFGKPFIIYPYNNEIIGTKKIVQIEQYFDFSKNLFKIEAFFVRPTIEKISEHRKEYIQVIHKDLLKQLKDIESI